MFFNIYQNDSIHGFGNEDDAVTDRTCHIAIMRRIPWVQKWHSDDLLCTTIYVAI